MIGISRDDGLLHLCLMIEHINLSKSEISGPLEVFFSSTNTLLTMIRDSMAHERDYIELGLSCGGICDALERWVRQEGLNYTVRNVMDQLTRIIAEIKHSIIKQNGRNRFARLFFSGNDKERIAAWWSCLDNSHRTLRRTLTGLVSTYDLNWATSNNLMDSDGDVSGHIITQHQDRSRELLPDGSLATESGASASMPHDLALDMNSDTPAAPDSCTRALQRLISRAATQDESLSLLEVVFSSGEITEIMEGLQGEHIQTFIDVIDVALDSPGLDPQVRKKYMKSLRRMCARHTLVPQSLKIELDNDSTGVLMCGGGFGDVWKRPYREREVAVKVLRVHNTDDLRVITRRFCREFVPWKFLRHPNVLPLMGVRMTENEFAMVSDWMQNGNINQFVTAHRDANRFELLADVARGLDYMHGQGMVHGDLKGANILVDQDCHARLADFGLLTTISDSTLNSSTSYHGGTIRWMSPELQGEIQDSPLTKLSDRYALGMVMYEVLSGRIPFHQYRTCTVAARVIRGDRPERPQGVEGVWFAGGVWEILERCWAVEPENRSSAEEVLQFLEEISGFWIPPPPPTNSPTSTTFELTGMESTDVDDVVGIGS